MAVAPAKKLVKLANELKNQKNVYFINSQNPKSNEQLLSILLNSQKLRGIYVTLNKGCLDIADTLKKNKVDISKVYFIDAISRNAGAKKIDVSCTYVSSPQALTELSLAIMTLVESKKFDFLYLDSLSTLLVYNDSHTTEQFIHYVIGKLKAHQIGMLVISLKGDPESARLFPILSQFADGSIDL